ncbi:unnamed protein product, partial [marine sediment metagenome]
MKRYSMQLIAYSNSVEIIAESPEEAIAKLHQNYGLSELGIADTGEEVLSVEEVKKTNKYGYNSFPFISRCSKSGRFKMSASTCPPSCILLRKEPACAA